MPLISISSLGSKGPSVIGSPALDLLAVLDDRAGAEREHDLVLLTLVVDNADRDALALVLAEAQHTGGTRQAGGALGVRASNSSTTRGRPPAMSLPATPPVWNVRIVSWVPGSPIDWAAITPTASPSSIDLPVASERP